VYRPIFTEASQVNRVWNGTLWTVVYVEGYTRHVFQYRRILRGGHQ